ncbi:MAG TPA: hypothetical protein PLK35_01235 [Candidatus Moranbacteria bacterium]|nr:hypothetical protein [Candidatus Moranbacteria bacterium]
MRVKKNKTCFKKYFFIAILSFALSFSPLSAKKSHAWLSFAAAEYKQMLEEISKHIDGVTLSILKQEAVRILTKQINKIVGGSSSESAMFITDWRDYLVKKPEDKTKKYMNDYLSKITQGKGSSSGYKSEGFFSGGSGGSYAKKLVDDAKKNTTEKPTPKVTYQEDPSKMFSEGNFKKMNLYLSGINNPWTFEANAQNEYKKRLAEEKKIAETKSVAYSGFEGKKKESKDGKETIINPGSLVKEAVANVQDIGNKILAAATHPEEVITAVVSQMITQALEQGIGQIEKYIDEEVDGVLESIGEDNLEFLKKDGPGSTYKNTDKVNIIQKTK